MKLLCLSFLAAASFCAAAQTVPVEDFFKRPDYSNLKLSPDGTRVAALVPGAKRDRLAVLNIETKTGRPVTNFGDADVLQFYWINDHRLVFNVGDAHTEWANAEYYGWYAVNADGSHLEEVAVAGPRITTVGHIPPHISYLGPHPDGG
jgi:hypothetical protein